MLSRCRSVTLVAPVRALSSSIEPTTTISWPSSETQMGRGVPQKRSRETDQSCASSSQLWKRFSLTNAGTCATALACWERLQATQLAAGLDTVQCGAAVTGVPTQYVLALFSTILSLILGTFTNHDGTAAQRTAEPVSRLPASLHSARPRTLVDERRIAAPAVWVGVADGAIGDKASARLEHLDDAPSSEGQRDARRIAPSAVQRSLVGRLDVLALEVRHALRELAVVVDGADDACTKRSLSAAHRGCRAASAPAPRSMTPAARQTR
jgi:hypothetical protein